MSKNVLERMKENDSEHKIAMFKVKQQQDYTFKRKYARIRAWEFYNHPEIDGMAYVAVGGLDSITLHVFLRSIGIDVPAISVSSLEDKSIQRVHKALGVKSLPPCQARGREVLEQAGGHPAVRIPNHIQGDRKQDRSAPASISGQCHCPSCHHHRRDWRVRWFPHRYTDAVGETVA